MREQLSRYVRGLAERELSASGPERYQDLGTFVCWLLERHGFTLHRRTFHFAGVERTKTSGRPEWGVDVIASRPDEDGVDRLFMFVLKKGDIGLDEWVDGRGTMMHDIRLAAGRSKAELSSYAPPGVLWDRATVVAVHNGDLDQEAIGAQVRSFLAGIEREYEVQTDWWHATRLVDLTFSIPSGAGDPTLSLLDASVFPPASQAFARIALDSLRTGSYGSEFNLAAVDMYVQQVLHMYVQQVLPTTTTSSGSGSKDASKVPTVDGLRLRRALEEISLFAGMIAVESGHSANSSALPLFDAIEHIIVHVAHGLSTVSADRWGSHKTSVRLLLDDLLRAYVSNALLLCDHLEAVKNDRYSLALTLPGEQISYPLRALRLVGYLAVAIFASSDLHDEQSAARLVDTLNRIVDANYNAVLSPITDDHVIEIGLLWAAWSRVGESQRIGRSASALVDALASRRLLVRPGPGLSQHARVPVSDMDLQVLVDVYLGSTVPEFTDDASTIVPVAVYMAERHGSPVPDGLLLARRSGKNVSDRPSHFCSFQTWKPPPDASARWYVEEITEGSMLLHRGNLTANELAQEFAEAAKDQVESVASAMGRLSVDWMAFKVWRTPPPPSLFLHTT